MDYARYPDAGQADRDVTQCAATCAEHRPANQRRFLAPVGIAPEQGRILVPDEHAGRVAGYSCRPRIILLPDESVWRFAALSLDGSVARFATRLARDRC
jgi:hypothetical protein